MSTGPLSTRVVFSLRVTSPSMADAQDLVVGHPSRVPTDKQRPDICLFFSSNSPLPLILTVLEQTDEEQAKRFQ